MFNKIILMFYLLFSPVLFGFCLSFIVYGETDPVILVGAISGGIYTAIAGYILAKKIKNEDKEGE